MSQAENTQQKRNSPPDPFSQSMELMQDWARQYWAQQAGGFFGDALDGKALGRFAESDEMKSLHKQYMDRHSALWQAMIERGQGALAEMFIKPEAGDRRFAAAEWRESPVFDYAWQSYLLNAGYIKDMAEILPVEDNVFRDRIRFLARQMADAMSPANFAATNPEFIRQALETQGKSITDGINNLIGDYEKGRISMTDESVFELGRNIATTAGAVVFENDVMQLIQYAPLTDKVHKRPLVVVPPSINKFYIMDLQAENSLIRFMVEQGHTVFLVSWRNPREEQAHLTWHDCIERGPIEAIAVARRIARAKDVNVVGFCVGGTMLVTALAVLAARGDKAVASLTLLTTLLDFADTGEIGMFIDESFVAKREATIGKGGLLSARELQTTFSFLRPNDLVWNYVINNYLKGKKPAAFDLLYWNSDSTNLPGPFAAWYMRNTYLENNLRVAGKVEVCGERIDLSRLKMPAYLLAAREDHIVPWQSAYRSIEILGGEKRFVLGASGHIAGVINPASKNKRNYWADGDQSGDAERWLATAQEKPGSWWNDWAVWAAQFGGGQRSARTKLGNAEHLPIEPAPGRYVKVRAI